jgi:hypothetical protein
VIPLVVVKGMIIVKNVTEMEFVQNVKIINIRGIIVKNLVPIVLMAFVYLMEIV